VLLLAASLAFYLSWSVPCVLLILFTSLSDYTITRKMGKTTQATFRRRLLVTSLIFNLGLLGFLNTRIFSWEISQPC